MTSESRSKFFGGADVSQGMTAILVCLASAVAALVQFTLTPKVSAGESTSTWLACAKANPAKRQWEVFNLKYGVFWVGCFAVIIAFSLYEAFDEVAYFTVCFGLCVPIFLFPLVSVDPSEARLAVGQRYGVRANVWIAVYSFIGNYWLSSSLEYVSFASSSPRECICVPGYPRAWNMSASYTHYFYGVLGAKYTFPSWRLNDVPIALIGATIFYFSLYHALSNLAIRKVVTSFEAGAARSLTLVVLVGAMAYAVAFAETLSISGFPYYEFEDRDMAYVFGSAFYGIYFIVSFPMFYLFGEWPQQDDPHRATKGSAEGLWSAAVNSMGGSMLILCLLDFVRLALGKALVIKG